MLLFGGQPDPNSNIVLPDRPDSAWTLNVQNSNSPSWTNPPQGWANEPSRRIHHSASSSGGKVFITGGQKADGSQTALDAHVVFDYTSSSFNALPTANGPPDLYGHTSLVLHNGSLLVFGGYSQSQNTLLPFSTIWTLDTWADTFTWSLIRVDDAALPPARCNFAAVVLSDGRILIHGGSDTSLQTTYSDGWILDTTKDPMIWIQVDSLSALGQRRDHMAVAIGSVVMFAFGAHYAQSL
jgi:N-acetylneuraminic acid mutarotase